MRLFLDSDEVSVLGNSAVSNDSRVHKLIACKRKWHSIYQSKRWWLLDFATWITLAAIAITFASIFTDKNFLEPALGKKHARLFVVSEIVGWTAALLQQYDNHQPHILVNILYQVLLVIGIGVDMQRGLLTEDSPAGPSRTASFKASALVKVGSDLGKLVAIFVRSSKRFMEASTEGNRWEDFKKLLRGKRTSGDPLAYMSTSEKIWFYKTTTMILLFSDKPALGEAESDPSLTEHSAPAIPESDPENAPLGTPAPRTPAKVVIDSNPPRSPSQIMPYSPVTSRSPGAQLSKGRSSLAPASPARSRAAEWYTPPEYLGGGDSSGPRQGSMSPFSLSPGPYLAAPKSPSQGEVSPRRLAGSYTPVGGFPGPSEHRRQSSLSQSESVTSTHRDL